MAGALQVYPGSAAQLRKENEAIVPLTRLDLIVRKERTRDATSDESERQWM